MPFSNVFGSTLGSSELSSNAFIDFMDLLGGFLTIGLLAFTGIVSVVGTRVCLETSSTLLISETWEYTRLGAFFFHCPRLTNQPN